MEIRKETLSALKMCRFCLCQDNSISSIYDGNQKSNKRISLPLKILACLAIEVFPSDRMPTYICKRCHLFVDLFHEFKQLCRKADERIMQYIQNGTALEPLNWPQPLTKVFCYAFKNIKKQQIVKTVVEGGATVQVTSQDGSNTDEDEDEENVYNIKIGDSSDGSKCIKVTSKNDPDSKEAIKPNRKEFTSISKLARHVRSHAGDRPHPCKYCNKTFMKSHHYTRHLRLKHPPPLRPSRGPFGSGDSYRCEQCEETFHTQDELIYHSAIHATQNLTCPLCQEKFEDVEAVTAHIKTHVYGNEFMCDLCELVFTTKEKLESHLTVVHADEIANELAQDDSSMELDSDKYEDDNGINLKEENGEMVVEIKKTGDYMMESEDKTENTNSEESESEVTYTELATVDTLAMVNKDVKINKEAEKSQPEASKPPVVAVAAPAPTPALNIDSQTASILRKAEEVKRKVQQSITEGTEKKIKTIKPESSNTVGGASDKSLRLLEKELQELKRTNTRNETSKTPAKPIESLKNRRPQLYTSTPKTRATEEKKALLSNKTPTVEKKALERRAVTKENKEPKETKEVKLNVSVAKEEKEKQVKEKEVKEKETPKNIVKNGTTDKSQQEETVRRSTRPSKIKDYAKMIRDKSQDSSDDEDSDDADYEESKEAEKYETRSKPRRASLKAAVKSPAAAAANTPAPVTRKRGRPRKEPKELPSKIKKEENDEEAAEVSKTEKTVLEDSVNKTNPHDDKEEEKETPQEKETDDSEINKSPSADEKTAGSQLTSPSGQTFKKVPIKAIPPGIKPLPLPIRPLGTTGELCEMQIGKKVVKVQKIIMTKAEVEAMTKKGLVEMKDGTMVLKQGIKLSTPESLKASLIGEKDAIKESLNKPNKSAASQSTADENT